MTTPVIVLVALLLLCGLHGTQAQEIGVDIESLVESAAQESEVSPQLDAVDYFMAHPLALREARPAELMLIPGFSAATARAVIRLARSDTVHTHDDIARILALSAEQRELLRLCTTLEPVVHAPVVLYRARYRTRLNTLRGFSTGSFTGSPLDLCQRLTVGWQNYELSLIADKDAGERSLADFIGGYLRGSFGTTEILMGDYSVQSGMGSILWRPFGARKGADVLSPAVRSATVLVPQRSTMEQQFFRGLALDHRLVVADSTTLAAALWVSSVQRAATIDSLTGEVTALDADGLFRTASERSRRNALDERAAGAFLEWSGRSFLCGASALALRYDRSIRSEAATAFAGAAGMLSSVHAAGFWKTTALAGEVARDAAGRIGLRAGMEQRDSTLRYALALRSFPNGFRSPFGYSFGESPRPGNESGLYAGCSWHPSADLTLAVYTDVYRTAGPTFTVPVPVRGLDLFGELHLRTARSTRTLFRLRREDKTEALTDEEGRRLVFQRLRSSLRAEVEHEVSAALRLRFRCEVVRCSFDDRKSAESGLLNSIEVRYRPPGVFALTSRLTYFSTDSFESALWAYEQTVPGTMSSPPLYGSGMRWTALLHYLPTSRLALRLFAGITAKNSVDTLGSGPMEIDGNTERNLVVQLDVTL